MDPRPLGPLRASRLLRARSALAPQASCLRLSWAPAHNSQVTSPLRRGSLSLVAGASQPFPQVTFRVPTGACKDFWKAPSLCSGCGIPLPPPASKCFPVHSLPRPLHARGWACRMSHRTWVNLEFWTPNESCLGITSMSHILDLGFLFAKSGRVTRSPDKASGREGHRSPFPSTTPNPLGTFVSALPSAPSPHGRTPRRGTEEDLRQLQRPVCVAVPAPGGSAPRTRLPARGPSARTWHNALNWRFGLCVSIPSCFWGGW